MSLRNAVGKVVVGSVSAFFFAVAAVSALVALTSEATPVSNWFSAAAVALFFIGLGLGICALTEFNEEDD